MHPAKGGGTRTSLCTGTAGAGGAESPGGEGEK